MVGLKRVSVRNYTSIGEFKSYLGITYPFRFQYQLSGKAKMKSGRGKMNTINKARAYCYLLPVDSYFFVTTNAITMRSVINDIVPVHNRNVPTFLEDLFI